MLVLRHGAHAIRVMPDGGMVSLTAPESVDTAISVLAGHGIRAWVAGEARADAENGGRVVLEGQHPGW